MDEKNLIGIEDPIWYDGVCCYQDTNGKHYSTRALIPIEEDELCRNGYIYKVKQIRKGDGPFNYLYKILSRREDISTQ